MLRNATDVVKEWERRQVEGCYKSYSESMIGLATLIETYKQLQAEQEHVDSYIPTPHDRYIEEQIQWREAGFTAYNCDNVDEFPMRG